MIVHCSLAHPSRATTTPRIARDASPGERLAGVRPRSLAGPHLLPGRSMTSAAAPREPQVMFCQRADLNPASTAVRLAPSISDRYPACCSVPGLSEKAEIFGTV